MLRYLSRIGPEEFNYELLCNSNDIDYLLDVCYMLSKARTKTERHALLQLLNSKLGKGQWFCNDKISAADVAAYSTMKQITSNEINVSLTKWLDRYDKM